MRALAARGIPVAGAVMVGEPNADNAEAIAQYGRVSVLGQLPRLKPLDEGSLKGWALQELDPAAKLAGYL